MPMAIPRIVEISRILPAALRTDVTAFWEATDWPQILALYDLLLQITPSPVVRLNRAVALRYVCGTQGALAEVESLAKDLDGYHLFHAIRGELLLDLGHREQARAAELRALGLTGNQAERSLLQRRLSLELV